MVNMNEQVSTPMLVEPDVEPKIIIDADLRTITVPKELINIGVVGDHYAETVYFECPRYFDGIDLSAKNCEIRYINAAGYEGISRAIDIVSGDTEITFGWEIDRNVTIKAGEICFAAFFYSMDGRGYQYGTTTATLNVLKGLSEGEILAEQDNTLLLQIQRQLATITGQIAEMQNNIKEIQVGNIDRDNTINLIDGEIKKINKEIVFLKDNVIYTSSVQN